MSIARRLEGGRQVSCRWVVVSSTGGLDWKIGKMHPKPSQMKGLRFHDVSCDGESQSGYITKSSLSLRSLVWQFPVAGLMSTERHLTYFVSGCSVKGLQGVFGS